MCECACVFVQSRQGDLRSRQIKMSQHMCTLHVTAYVYITCHSYQISIWQTLLVIAAVLERSRAQVWALSLGATIILFLKAVHVPLDCA